MTYDTSRVLGREMQPIPEDEWPFMQAMEAVPERVWLSRDYLAVLYRDRVNGTRRLTVNRTRRGRRGEWRDGITWDELQRVKNECLGPDAWCMELYPAEADVVNVSNMRHLWVLPGPSEYAFRRSGRTDNQVAAQMFERLVRGRYA